MANDSELGALFNDDGYLNRRRLGPDALSVLEGCTAWLHEVSRSVYLPIDLLVVLLERGHEGLRQTIATSARGVQDAPELLDQLKQLAERVERESEGPARLHLDQFSLGFAGLLHDALTWAQESKRARISEPDLVRVMRWRAELQESASVRWAIRQLSQPGGELLFEANGQLRSAAFSAPIWEQVHEAMRLSCRTGLSFLGTPQMMAALCTSRGLLVRACEDAGVSPRTLHDDLLAIVGQRSPVQQEFQLNRQTITPRLVRMLVVAARAAEREGQSIAEVHLLHAFLEDGGSSLQVVRAQGLVGPIQRHVDMAMSDAANPARVSIFDGHAHLGSAATPTLDLLGRDLTAEAKEGKLPTVLGREEELQRVINVLMRSEQRNPLLTGKAGVGKTALAVALAQRIADERVPGELARMRVVEINGASLVGGTSYRGELEARIKGLLDECDGDVILFIDEAHAVFAPRSSAGQPAEVPNHFKAALASGRIAVVAATTEMEYRRWIEEDPALRRRFERIDIPELSPEFTRTILASLAPKYEERYEVPVTPEAVDAAVELSSRFLPEQSLPDKAKKLLMDATIAVASERALAAVEADGDAGGTPSKRVVSRIDVARQIAQKTGAPLDRIVAGSIRWWVGLEERLRAHIPGQDAAVEAVARSLIASRLSGMGRRRPQSVFLFAGPPGVGKRALATGLASEIYGSARAVVRLEMADFAEAHSISRLIGTPPGYVGYQDEDALVTPLRRKPSCVVLLENFHLAHPRVQERIARIFSDGEITDTRGMSADASHAIFVLTLDVELEQRAGIGFAGDRSATALDLKSVDAELAERLKGHSVEFVAFEGLTSPGSDLGRVLFSRRLASFRASLMEEYGLQLALPEEREQELLARVDALSDARDIERLFHEGVIEPVCDLLLEGTPEGDVVRVSGVKEPTPA